MALCTRDKYSPTCEPLMNWKGEKNQIAYELDMVLHGLKSEKQMEVSFPHDLNKHQIVVL